MKRIFIFMLSLMFVFTLVAPIAAAFAETAEAPVVVEETTAAQPIDPTDVSWLTTYLDYAIVGICVVIGLLVKHCTPLDNKYIPLIVAVVGLLVAVWSNWGEGITPIVLLGGLFSGLASTGFHQVFKQLFFTESK